MEVIQVLDRAFTILERFAESHNQPLTVRELAEHTHLKVPTVSRIVRTLMILGYLESLGRKSGYVLGRRFAELSRFYFDANPLRKAAQPYLVRYRELFDEYICLSILLGYERHILSRLEPYRTQHSRRHVIPDIEIPYSSVSGRLLLSSQPQILQRKCFEWFGPPGSQWEGTDTLEAFSRKTLRNPHDSVPSRRTGIVPVVGLPHPRPRWFHRRNLRLLYAAGKISTAGRSDPAISGGCRPAA